jgi:hypothetical protein
MHIWMYVYISLYVHCVYADDFDMHELVHACMHVYVYVCWHGMVAAIHV